MWWSIVLVLCQDWMEEFTCGGTAITRCFTLSRPPFFRLLEKSEKSGRLAGRRRRNNGSKDSTSLASYSDY